MFWDVSNMATVWMTSSHAACCNVSSHTRAGTMIPSSFRLWDGTVWAARDMYSLCLYITYLSGTPPPYPKFKPLRLVHIPKVIRGFPQPLHSWISVQTPSIPTDVYRGFPVPQGKYRDSTLIKPRPLPCIFQFILGFEVLTAVVMKSIIFWDITPCSAFKVNRRFGGTYRLHLQGRKISGARNRRESRWKAELCFPPVYFSIMKMEATLSSETSADFQRTTRRYIPFIIH
jgi:hypothetical protein